MNSIPKEILLSICCQIHPYHCKLHMTSKTLLEECNSLVRYIGRFWFGKWNSNLTYINYSDIRFASLLYAPIPQSIDKFDICSLIYHYYTAPSKDSSVNIEVWILNAFMTISRSNVVERNTSVSRLLSLIFTLYQHTSLDNLKYYISVAMNNLDYMNVYYNITNYIAVMLGASDNETYLETVFQPDIIDHMFDNLTLSTNQIISIIWKMTVHGQSLALKAVVDRLNNIYDNTNDLSWHRESYDHYYREASLVLCRYNEHFPVDVEAVRKLFPKFELKPFRTSFSTSWRYNSYVIKEDKIPHKLKGIYYIMRSMCLEFMDWKHTVKNYMSYLINYYHNQYGALRSWYVYNDIGHMSYMQMFEYPVSMEPPKLIPRPDGSITNWIGRIDPIYNVIIN